MNNWTNQDMVDFYEWTKEKGWEKYPKLDRWVNKGFTEKYPGKKFSNLLDPHTSEELLKKFEER